LSAGSRRNGTSKTGPFPLAGHSRRGHGRPGHGDETDPFPPAGHSQRSHGQHAPGDETGPFPPAGHGQPGGGDETGPLGQRPPRYSARHATARPKTARWAGKAVPAAAIAATLAAGAAAYGLVSGQPGNGKAVALDLPAAAGSVMGAANADAAAARLSPVGDPATAHATATPTHATASPTPAPAHPSPTATATAAAASSAPASSTAALTCSDSSYLLPANVTAIVSFLLANGYTHNAAAGIAGNIYQESKGNPESVGSGGGGLIGWTPLQAGFVTGNPSADLQTQLAAVLTYNDGWSAYLPALNAAATPADAAYIYVTDFERAGIPAASTREASADAVAAACGL
jgi:Phage tail lysozyme